MSLEIKRRYDSNTGLETTNYIKSKCGNDKEVFTFTQKFFTFDEIAESINQDIWNMDIISSSESHSRKNNQKNMLVLRKK